MKAWEKNIVPVSFGASALLFLFAAIKPLLEGQEFDAAFLAIGATCFVIAIATWRKSREHPGSPGA